MINIKKAISLTLFSMSAIVSCFFSAAHATTVIDFEGYSAGTIIDTEYAGELTMSAVNLGSGPDAAVIFDTTNPTGGDTDLVPIDYNPGNVLIIHETNNCDANTCDNPDDEASGGIFYLDFASIITLESIDFFDIEATENGQTPYNVIKLFDAADNEIMPDTFYIPGTGGDNTWDQLLFNVDGIKRIELNMAGSGAIDNITYRARVPLPAAAWLFASGFIGLITLARRKKA